MKGQRLKIIFLGFLFLISTSAASAQEGRGQGRVSGTVKDENGNPIEGAEILCESLEFNFSLKTTSDKKGKWAIVGVGPSVFRITASKKEFIPSETQMKLSHFRSPPVDFVLKSISPSSLWTEEDVDVSKELFQEATTLFDGGKYSTALQLFQSFLEKNPTLFQVQINIGNCYREMGEHEKALAEYETVLDKLKEKNPDLQGNKSVAQALTHIGETYLMMDDMEKAQPYLEQAIEIFPNDHALAFNVAEIYFKDGNIDQAIEYYTLATKIKPDWPLAYLKMGYAYVNKGNYDQAITSFEKFLELAPKDEEAEKIRNLIPQLEKLKKD
jgi:tetratricopeptide (TPR) repeat protein